MIGSLGVVTVNNANTIAVNATNTTSTGDVSISVVSGIVLAVSFVVMLIVVKKSYDWVNEEV